MCPTVSSLVAFRIIQHTCGCRTQLKDEDVVVEGEDVLGCCWKYTCISLYIYIMNFLKISSNSWRNNLFFFLLLLLKNGAFLHFTVEIVVFYRNWEDEVCAPGNSSNSPKNSVWVIEAYVAYFRYSHNTNLKPGSMHMLFWSYPYFPAFPVHFSCHTICVAMYDGSVSSGSRTSGWQECL